MQLLGPDFRNGMVERVKLRQPSPRYGDFSTFQDGGRRHLGFLGDHCLSVCPVCNVRALWPNGWMDQAETWHAGRAQPWPHCVR